MHLCLRCVRVLFGQGNFLAFLWPTGSNGGSPWASDDNARLKVWTPAKLIPIPARPDVFVGHARNACAPGTAEPPPTEGSSAEPHAPQPGEEIYKREHFQWHTMPLNEYYTWMVKVRIHITMHLYEAVYKMCISCTTVVV